MGKTPPSLRRAIKRYQKTPKGKAVQARANKRHREKQIASGKCAICTRPVAKPRSRTMCDYHVEKQRLRRLKPRVAPPAPTVIIENKRQAYALYNQGKFGNKLRTWDSVKDFVYSGHTLPVSMRYKGTGGAWFAYNVPAKEVADRAKQWIREGADPLRIVVNESAPDERLVMQGELILTWRGLCLLAHWEKVKMRVAISQCTERNEITGVRAYGILKHLCTGPSYDDLMLLLEQYPDSAIEFSIYEMCLGSCPGRNTLIWEVRNY
jgi:hypothetical protein